MSSPQQEVQDKKKNQDLSIKYDADSDSSKNNNNQNNKNKKEKRKAEAHSKEEKEGEPILEKPRQDLTIPKTTHQIQDEENNESITIDYMAKDYASFRHALLDLIPRKIPQWSDKSEADMGIMLIELFSYIADELSYFQDRVANEAFLRTARARSSINSHLNLIDYHMHNGLSANAFIKVEVNTPVIIPTGFQVSTYPEKGQKEAGNVIFETLQEQLVLSDYNNIPVYKIDNDYSNSSDNTMLRSALLQKRLPELKKGHLVLFFLQDRLTRVTTRNMLVKLGEDSRITHDGMTVITWKKGQEYPEPLYDWKSGVICCANIIRASHGQTIHSEILKHRNQKVSKFLFTLKEAPLSFVSESNISSSNNTSTLQEARSTVVVRVNGELWEETDSLVKCGPFDQKFSISVDEDGYATILFGDGKFGLKPDNDSLIEAEYRVGSGSVGNVSKDTLTRFDMPQNPPHLLVKDVMQSVTNPFPATGGVDIESKDDARIAGPRSLKVLERAVTPKDYEELVRREFQNEITNARARFVYTGSWDTIFVSVDLKGKVRRNIFDHSELFGRIRKYLERVKMIGYEVQVEEAKYVPIEIGITIYLRKYFDSEVLRDRILCSLSSNDNKILGSTNGLFHPDNFTFGDPVYASKIYEVLKDAPEVKYGIITTFRKRHAEETVNKWDIKISSASSSSSSSLSSFSPDSFSTAEIAIAQRDEETKSNLELGYIPVDNNEIIRIDNDASHPENGTLVLNFVGDHESKQEAVGGNEEDNDYGYSLWDEYDPAV